MGKHPLIDLIENEQLKKEVVEFQVGDTVRVSTKIVEGEKERTQAFQGTVIARRGNGIAETFSLHRLAHGEGMERVFPLHSPRITNIEVIRKGVTRRSKLYYLRGTSGKAAKLREKIGGRAKRGDLRSEATMNDNDNEQATENESHMAKST